MSGYHFLYPSHHTHSTSNSSKRPRTSTASAKQTVTALKKLFSYTRYDWNFLLILPPTVPVWFCVINRIQKAVEKLLRKREKRLDVILTYFLVETKPVSTLSQSKFYDLLTSKTKYLLSHPVCQLVTELRKQFNCNTQMNMNLQPNIILDLQLLKQGIRVSCREWAQTIKQQPHKIIVQPPSSSTTTSPINSILPTTSNDQEQPPAVVRAPTMVDRVQRLIGHEFVTAHPRPPTHIPTKQHDGYDSSITNGSAIQRRTTVQNTRSNINNKDTTIEMNNDNNDLSGGDGRRASSFLADAIRRFEPAVNVNNTNGYKRLSVGHDESDFEGNTSGIRLNDSNHDNETTYYTDITREYAGSVEQLFKILLEYADVEISVSSSIEPLFEKLVLFVTNLSVQSICRQSPEYDQLHSANVQAGTRAQRVQHEVKLSLIRLIYQFYTVVGNALEYTGIDEITKFDTNTNEQQNDSTILTFENGIQILVLRSLDPNILHLDNNELDNSERQCWKKLRELVSNYRIVPEIKPNQPSIISRKQQRSGSQPPNEHVPQQQHPTRHMAINVTNETLLLSSFGWLIIDEIHYAPSLGGLKVNGCMKKVQENVSLSQRL
ncbi:unnamed protein product [Adineta steineri]|uniref:Uncharacterized protein n=1 Tax=Adineta steineri TaxID=433720 RepID=A0A814UCH9_9BILA|nr:unnamed protein product [Adineta steineri]CAF1202706.1 unnamed protein product [Adineta steineri]